MTDRPPPPPEFLEAAPATPEQLAAARPAIKAVEAAIAAHHVIDVRYRRKDAEEVTLRVEPYAFRSSHAGALVIWVWDVEAKHLDSLYADSVEALTDTGRTFPAGDHW